MDYRLLFRLIGERLADRTTWVLAFVVGTLINLYGQLLVPWFRGSFDPVTDFIIEYEIRPALTVFSVFLAYAFPVFVGIYSAVTARYKNRRMESVAKLPDSCPNPVFRAESSGRIAEAGSDTRRFLEKYGVQYAQNILGEELWARIASNQPMADRPTIYFEPHQAAYVVAHAPSENQEINVYLARLPKALETVPRD